MNLAQQISKKWKPRKPKSHKGDFGRVFILAGSKRFTGAAYLASAAGIRAGAGLVTLGVPEAVYPILARKSAEVMVHPFASTRDGSLSFRALRDILRFIQTQNVAAVGPGLSQNPETQKLLLRLFPQINLPLVIDADGLNALAQRPAVLKGFKKGAVITPHPGEFKRLFGISLTDSESDRETQALKAARRFGVIVVLKGSPTVVASPDGRLYRNRTGNPGLAKGGTGDVLTGIIAALIGQKFSLWESACYGVFFHGLAADIAVRKMGQVALKATDVIEALPRAFKKILKW